MDVSDAWAWIKDESNREALAYITSTAGAIGLAATTALYKYYKWRSTKKQSIRGSEPQTYIVDALSTIRPSQTLGVVRLQYSSTDGALSALEPSLLHLLHKLCLHTNSFVLVARGPSDQAMF